MEFMDLIRKRYSVRRFDSGRKVEQEKIGRLLEAVRLSPSAHNFQSFRVLVLEGEEALEKLKSCTPCHYHAPLAFVVSFDKDVCWKREADGKSAGQIDAAIAAVHLMLAAYDEGIGGTWVMGFDEAALRRTFHIPDRLEPTAVFVCGYPAADVRPSSRHGQRQPVEEFTVYGDYRREE